MPDEETFLNFDFWQAVGLTLRRREMSTCTACAKGERKCPWHRFIDHLAAGNAPKAFFTSLSAAEKINPDVKGYTNKSMQRVSTVESAKEKSTQARSLPK